MSKLDHPTLRQFLAVAEAGTVRAAARQLNMSQPPLTAKIRQLEDRLDTRLFERSVRGMALTQAGEALAQEARILLGRLERAEARVRALGGRPRPLRIGFVSAALSATLSDLLLGLRQSQTPTPELREMTTPEQLDALVAGQIDIALLHPPVPALPDFEGRQLGRDPFWAALPADHRLARRRSIRFAEIAGEPFVLFPRSQGPALFETIETLATEAAGRLQIAAEASRVHSHLALIAGGLGVGLITRSTAQRLSFHGVTAIPLKDTQDRLFLELQLMAEPDRLQTLSHLFGGTKTSRKR